MNFDFEKIMEDAKNLTENDIAYLEPYPEEQGEIEAILAEFFTE